MGYMLDLGGAAAKGAQQTLANHPAPHVICMLGVRG
jgi:hypothetical protein